MSYQIITPSSEEPVTLAQAKAQCRVDSADENTFITSLIQPARELAEHRTGRALMTQTLEWAVADLSGDKIPFPVSPVQSIESIKYTDSSGVEQTLSPNVYVLDKTGQGKHYLRLKNGQSWPSAYTQFDAVKVTFVAGYADAAAVPGAVKQWILMAVTVFYQNRGLTNELQTYELPESFCSGLLNTVKIWGL